MQGLTAKVFRTYNASYTMSQLLQDMTAEGTIPEKVLAYNNANRRVAILCNHKRTVAASHAQQMEKMEDKIKALRYQQYRLKQMILATEPKLKKKKGENFFALPGGIDREWQEKHHNDLVAEARSKIQKKFDKENEKLEAEGSKPMKAKELEQRMEPADELEAKLKKELKTGKVIPEGKSATVEKYEKDIEKLDTRIATLEMQAEDRDNNKEVALGTSKIVSCPYNMHKAQANNTSRTTSTHVSLWFSARSSTSQSSDSSLKPFARSSTGLSSLSMRIGSSRLSTIHMLAVASLHAADI